MADLDFWFGFSFGVGTMFVLIALVTICVVIQVANSHDSRLEKKENQ